MDIAKFKNADDPRFVIQNWMRTRSSIEFLGIWEILYNPIFNRVEFDTVKNQSGSNAFVMTPSKWIEFTGAIGIQSKAGRYGGTYAHKDIAFEFASWVSVEFKLYLIKEFQRLQETEQKQLGWDVKRNLSACKNSTALPSNKWRSSPANTAADFWEKQKRIERRPLVHDGSWQIVAKLLPLARMANSSKGVFSLGGQNCSAAIFSVNHSAQARAESMVDSSKSVHGRKPMASAESPTSMYPTVGIFGVSPAAA